MDFKSRDFFDSVYQVVRLVPPGRVTSYGAIGKYLGLKSSARMVGWAMNACHNDSTIPAHRVVNSQGILSGKMHFVPLGSMEERLISEGVQIKDDRVLNFKTVFWDPVTELEL